MKCGLLGRKLGHSYSPQIHSYLGDYAYDLYEKEPSEIEDFLKHSGIHALNVTMPYKIEVIPFLDELSPVAKKLGAVNTIVRRADGTLFGHNTDYFGFYSLVKRCGLNVAGKKVLVLGSGGASNTAVAVLKELGASVIVISRTGENHYGNLHLHSDAAAIVNATPVGMYPNTGVSPVDLTQFPRLEGVLDIVYNPARTQLLLDAEKLGIPAENGLWMLVAQAKEASEYFSGQPLDNGCIAFVYRKLCAQMQNIVLIGMPGCGKSTIGRLLSQALNRPLVDVDEEIVRLASKSIPQIFSEDGEEAFREWETRALEHLGKQSGLIIATGGGCVTRSRNYPLLHQNGIILWLQRELTKLPTDGRPLSQTNKLADLYALRKPLYEAFADCSIDNNGSSRQTISAILAKLEESL